jgi:hypothetical protein
MEGRERVRGNSSADCHQDSLTAAARPTSRRCASKPDVQAAERTGDARACRQDGRGRRPVGLGRQGRREEGGEMAEHHLFRPPPRSANASERKLREEEVVGFVSNRFRSVWGRKRAKLKLEFGNLTGNSGRILGLISTPLQMIEFGSEFWNS